MGMIGEPIRKYTVPDPTIRYEPSAPLLLPAPTAVPVEPMTMPVRQPVEVGRDGNTDL